jgi:hypothetical protein
MISGSRTPSPSKHVPVSGFEGQADTTQANTLNCNSCLLLLLFIIKYVISYLLFQDM